MKSALTIKTKLARSISLREQWISRPRNRLSTAGFLLPTSQPPNSFLSTLYRGESEVIVLALEQKASLVLIDELAARQVCKSLNIPITGSNRYFN
ncbi:MAG UNVERIFIED_CONTAM: hypothetical protein LVR29_13550 [Microcystis novacekii LVE1205-3]